MDSLQVLAHLKRHGAKWFTNECLFNDHTWYFPSTSGIDYSAFKEAIAEIFLTESQNIAVVGSAKYGFSLSPNKNFDAFDSERSDIDVVIVARGHFRATWHQLRRAYYKNAITSKSPFLIDIFRRFVTIGPDDHVNTKYLMELMRLLDKINKASTSQLGIGEPIKFRIYETWTDAKSYHIWSLQKLGVHHGIQ